MLDRLQRNLSEDEVARAGRYRFQRDRDNFVIARGTLREILGRYLNLAPGDLRFQYGPQGKPVLEGDPLRFNLSHTRLIALYVVSADREVGIDVEDCTGAVEFRQIARQQFTPEEAASLDALPDDAARRRFFALWTRKEALAKGLGTGLSVPLGQLAEMPSPWSCRGFVPFPGHAAALVVEGEVEGVYFWEWGAGVCDSKPPDESGG
ncbi:MAG: 4'-phosphopantetheinyl transferase family protein [Armatimonadota bacterium]